MSPLPNFLQPRQCYVLLSIMNSIGTPLTVCVVVRIWLLVSVALHAKEIHMKNTLKRYFWFFELCFYDIKICYKPLPVVYLDQLHLVKHKNKSKVRTKSYFSLQ